MRLLVLLLLSVVLVHGVEPEERERLREELSETLFQLVEPEAALALAASKAGDITIPPGVAVTLTARRTLAKDWLRRFAGPVEFSVEEADNFREGLQGLSGRIDNVARQLEHYASAAERWSQSTEKPEFLRYRTYLRSRAEQSLLEIAAGGDQHVDEEAHERRKRRHELILQLIEAGDPLERWTLVPKNSQVLREYQDLRASLRATAEAGLHQANPSNDAELDRDERVLGLLDEQLSLGQGWAERSNGREIPPDAPMLRAYRAAQVAEVQSLRALIAHQRLMKNDDEAWERQNEVLRRERDERARFTGFAWEGLEFDLSISQQRRHLDEILPDMPPALQDTVKKRLVALDQSRGVIVRALAKAVGDGMRTDAIRAKGALRVAQRNVQALNEELEQRREREATEQEWRDHAAQPSVAATLAKLDAAWTAITAARERQIQIDHAAIEADIARELADVATEVAQLAAQHNQRELEQAREQIELRRQEVTDAVENPQPKPEGDAKF